MRLGGTTLYRPENLAELNAVPAKLDVYGLSTIVAPLRLGEMSEDEAIEYGKRADELDILIGEGHYLVNLMTRDPAVQTERIDDLRNILRKADLMKCCGVIAFAGTVDPADSIAAPHRDNFTDWFKAEFRETVLRILDGLDLEVTKLVLEANNKAFYYGPEAIAEFVAAVDHPGFGVHLDQMNMVDQFSYWDTTSLINTTFELLGDHVVGAHLKDIRVDWHYTFLKLDEVLIGDGVLDCRLLVDKLAGLGRDLPCFCEHLSGEGEYAINFARLQKIAAELGHEFVARRAGSVRA